MLRNLVFQSLFCWICLGRKAIRFTLLILTVCFNPCFVGFALGGSIGNKLQFKRDQVSILVLLDLPWEVDDNVLI